MLQVPLPEDAVYRSVRWIILLLILAACRETRSESGRDGAPDVTARTGGAEPEGSEPGVEFEAPRLIPAIRAQIIEIEDPEGATEGNPAAFRRGVGTLVNAMRADLTRVGATDTGGFYALGDSVLRKLGGDAGAVVSQVERLIEIYEEGMRKAAD
jgi:hypothetical protein